jgi:SAM-dependent methyltransferase
MGWYHSLELAPGFETTGIFDMRQHVQEYHLPERMDGMRVLEVGCWDGFWSFEMESRGAEVSALDLDWEKDLDWPPRRRPSTFPEHPRGHGFALAKELKGSGVDRVNCSVYHALPEDLGQFDMVFCGSVLIHLRDQLLALERIANLTKLGGFFISAEEYDPLSGLMPFPVSRYRADRDSAVVFWQPSIRTWKRMMWTAGFDRIEQKGRFRMRSNEGYSVRHVVLHAFKGKE